MDYIKCNVEVGDRAIVDKEFNNSLEVVVLSFSPNKMFAKVRADDNYEWTLMSDRLTKINK